MQTQHKVDNCMDSKAFANTWIAVLTSKEILDSRGTLFWKPSFLMQKHSEVPMPGRVKTNCLTTYKSINNLYHTHLPQS